MIRSAEFDRISSLLYRDAGVVLSPDKAYFVEARLSPVLRDLGWDYSMLCRRLDAEPDHPARQLVVEALVTHETRFFRDPAYFDLLRDRLLPSIIAERSKSRRLRIWSAAAATGQEALSLAILISEDFPQLRAWDIEILGTDLSHRVIGQARRACYLEHEISRGLTPALRDRYFDRNGGTWVAGDEIREWTRFEQLNLLQPWPGLLSFDLVLLRHVLIYLDAEHRTHILGRMRRHIEPFGVLLLGGVESTTPVDDFDRHFAGSTTWFTPATRARETTSFAPQPSDRKALASRRSTDDTHR